MINAPAPACPVPTPREFAVAILVLLLCLSRAWAQIPTSGLVANYPFSGSAADNGPSALHGTVNAATLTTDRFGNANSAYAFNGTSAYIQLPDHDAFTVPTTGALSISVWLRPDVLVFPVDESTGYVHWMGKGVSGQHEWTFRMYSFDNTENRENRTSFYMFNLTGGQGAGSYVQEPITTGAWIHYVAVVNMSTDTITWYKNAVQKDQDPFQVSQYNIVPGNGTAPVRIGTRDFASYFQGAIDDVRFYNRVLSVAEIQQLYAEGTGATPPAPPAGLVATSGNNQVALAWNASLGAASYNVKRSTISGSGYSTLASVTTTSHTDTTAVNGTTYFYVVSAVNAGGESLNSSEVWATPQPPPPSAAPTGLTATGGKKKITLAWAASAGAASYSVKRSNTSGGPYATIATGVTSTTFANTGLTTGSTYYYVVSAVNAGGESANSNQASATAR